jgi:uncharacterized membrane protein YgcG
MNKILLNILIGLLILSSFVSAEKHFINDSSNFLDNADKGKLQDVCMHIEAETGLYIGIIMTTSSYNISDYDILLYWNEDKKESKIIINHKDIIPDIVVNSLKISAQPLFDNGKYYEGFRFILNEIQIEVGAGGQGDGIGTGIIHQPDKVFMIIFIIIFFLFGMGILCLIIDKYIKKYH